MEVRLITSRTIIMGVVSNINHTKLTTENLFIGMLTNSSVMFRPKSEL